MTTAVTAALTGLFVWTSVAGGTIPLTADASTTSPVVKDAARYSVAMTAYNAVPGQTDGDPSTTASGLYSNPEIIAARSQDLADELPFGTIIEVESAADSTKCGFDAVSDQIGLRVIGDTMNARMHKKIDILFPSEKTVTVGSKKVSAARALGVCDEVKIKVVGHMDLNKIPKTQDGLRVAMGYLPKAQDERLAVSK